MFITTIHEAITIKNLVKRIAPNSAAGDRARVTAALLKANPGLGGSDRIDAQTVLVIPAVEGVTFAPAAGTSGLDSPVEELGDRFALAVKEYGVHLAKRHEVLKTRLKFEAEQLGSKQFLDVVSKRPDIKELIPQVENSIKDRRQSAAEEYRQVQEAIKELADTLGASIR